MSTTTLFLWRNKKKICNFWLKNASYLELCSAFNIKTAPLIRPFLDSTKDGLYSGVLLILFTHALCETLYVTTFPFLCLFV